VIVDGLASGEDEEDHGLPDRETRDCFGKHRADRVE